MKFYIIPNRLFWVVLIALVLFVAVVPAIAQDDLLVTNTPAFSEPVITVEPPVIDEPPVVVEPPAPAPEPSERTLYVLGFLGFLIFSGAREFISTRQVGKLVETVNKALDNKQTLDEARQRYMEASLSTQEFVKLLRGIVGFAGSINIPIVDPALDKGSEWLREVTAPPETRQPSPN